MAHCCSGMLGKIQEVELYVSCCPGFDVCRFLTLVVGVSVEKEVGGMEMAHEGMIWSLAWHPLGHILCSGSNDHTRYAQSPHQNTHWWRMCCLQT